LRPNSNFFEENSYSMESADNSEAVMRKRICKFFAALLPECWNRDPEARLSSLRIKKDLLKFCEEVSANYQTFC
uniref:Serine/threonine protein kinase n=1 Tax=Rodentolepis nana TaxID=102285 RepID=A0A0R3TQF2_RODNA